MKVCSIAVVVVVVVAVVVVVVVVVAVVVAVVVVTVVVVGLLPASVSDFLTKQHDLCQRMLCSFAPWRLQLFCLFLRWGGWVGYRDDGSDGGVARHLPDG